MRSHGPMVELRGELPREIADTLDAVSIANDKSRFALVTEILHEWHSLKRREAMLILQIGQSNPDEVEACRHQAEGRG